MGLLMLYAPFKIVYVGFVGTKLVFILFMIVELPGTHFGATWLHHPREQVLILAISFICTRIRVSKLLARASDAVLWTDMSDLSLQGVTKAHEVSSY